MIKVKFIFLVIVCFLVSIFSCAQNVHTVFHLTSGDSLYIPLSKIDSISFYEGNVSDNVWKFVKYDTLRSNVIIQDTVRYEIIQNDTVFNNIFVQDTVHYEIIQNDTVHKNVLVQDTIRYEIIQNDTVHNNVIVQDTIHYEIIQNDTIYTKFEIRDTIRYQAVFTDTIYKDTVIYETNPRFKTFSVLGDSFSTFKGLTIPLDARQYYPCNGWAHNDVDYPQQMWWYQFGMTNGCFLASNCSWSGSAISYKGYSQGSFSNSFVSRVKDVIPADLIIVEGATNDNNTNPEIGSIKLSGWTEDDFWQFCPALCYVFDVLKQTNPNSTIVFMLNEGLKESINSAVELCCNTYGVYLFRMEHIQKDWDGHPTEYGMKQISEQFTNFLNENCKIVVR